MFLQLPGTVPLTCVCARVEHVCIRARPRACVYFTSVCVSVCVSACEYVCVKCVCVYV